MAAYPHIEWLDLYGDGTLHESATVKRDANGNVYFIRLRDLDMVDRRRIARILTGRNATNFALWDLLFQTTLGNGMNALEYFHQYVKILTPHGQIMTPQVGRIGAAHQGVLPSTQRGAQQPATKTPAKKSAARVEPPAE